MNLYELFILGVNIKYIVFSILYRHINVPTACKELMFCVLQISVSVSASFLVVISVQAFHTSAVATDDTCFYYMYTQIKYRFVA